MVSLFCGAGGLDLGFERAGFVGLLAVDSNRDAVATYRANLRDVAALQDVRTFSPAADLLASGCDVVAGGPPCQGFSIGGHMRTDDCRSELVWEFVRVVRQLLPRAFVMENVAALATHPKWHTVRDKLVAEFAAAGYAVGVHLLDAAHSWRSANAQEGVFCGRAGEPYATRCLHRGCLRCSSCSSAFGNGRRSNASHGAQCLGWSATARRGAQHRTV